MKVCRHSLIWGLSYALDITGDNNLSHSKSTAYLAVLIGRELGVSEDRALTLYYAALLHDIGISNTYELYEHCVLGEEMLRGLPIPQGIPECVLYHHEFCDGTGVFGLEGGRIPEDAQIICLASAFDDDFGSLDRGLDSGLISDVYGWLDKYRPRFSEKVAGAFAALIKREYFLLDYFNYETKYSLSGKMVSNCGIYYGYDEVVKFARCFAGIIDHRSPFTLSHSRGVAGLAREAAAHLGHGAETQDLMYIAGLLHDIGKLNVSVDILHKNGKLTPEERFEINKHSYFTRKILEQIDGFGEIVDIAANHHEKLDGTGYPYHMPGERLGELERIMSICDVYQALREERPYRERLSEEKVWGIIGDMVAERNLDGGLAGKLRGAFSKGA